MPKDPTSSLAHAVASFAVPASRYCRWPSAEVQDAAKQNLREDGLTDDSIDFLPIVLLRAVPANLGCNCVLVEEDMVFRVNEENPHIARAKLSLRVDLLLCVQCKTIDHKEANAEATSLQMVMNFDEKEYPLWSQSDVLSGGVLPLFGEAGLPVSSLNSSYPLHFKLEKMHKPWHPDGLPVFSARFLQLRKTLGSDSPYDRYGQIFKQAIWSTYNLRGRSQLADFWLGPYESKV